MNNTSQMYGEQVQPPVAGGKILGKGKINVSQLTEEEIKVLGECKRNSLMRGFLGGAAGYGVWHLITDSHLGSFMKYRKTFRTFTAVGGLFYGMASYADTCRKKILALDNSALADEYRQKLAAASSKLGLPLESQETYDHAIVDLVQERIGVGRGNSPSTEEAHYPPETHQYTAPQRNQQEEEDGEKQPVTFAELRQQNRQQYDPAHMPLLRRPPPGHPPMPAPAPPAPEQTSQQFSLDEHAASSQYSSDVDLISSIHERRPTTSSAVPQTKTWSQATNRKNKYGDDME